MFDAGIAADDTKQSLNGALIVEKIKKEYGELKRHPVRVQCDSPTELKPVIFADLQWNTSGSQDVRVLEWQVLDESIDVTPKFMLFIYGNAGKKESSLVINLCRIDNKTQPSEKSVVFNVLDSFWQEAVGWERNLQLILHDADDKEVCIVITQNKSTECIQMIIPESRVTTQKVGQNLSHQIPKHIFQTSKSSLIPCLQKSTASFRWLNPAWNYHMLIDEQGGYARMLRQIRNLEGERAAASFSQLAPGAYRSDFWRYIMLYHYGGVYSDDKITLLYPLDSILKSGMKALLINDVIGKGIYNGFIAIEPRHPLMLLTIRLVIDNTERRYYGTNALQITGPMLLGRALDLCGLKCTEGLHFLSLKRPGDTIVEDGNERPLLLTHNIEYRRVTFGKELGESYQQMWLAHSVYYEDAKFKKELARPFVFKKGHMNSRMTTAWICAFILLACYLIIKTRKIFKHHSKSISFY